MKNIINELKNISLKYDNTFSNEIINNIVSFKSISDLNNYFKELNNMKLEEDNKTILNDYLVTYYKLTKKIDYKNSDIILLQDIERKQLLLKSKLYFIEPISDDAINIRIEVNKLSEQRLEILKKYDNDAEYISRQLDSLEYRYINLKDISKTKPVELSCDEYIETLKEIINKISDLSIYKLKSKYLQFSIDESNEEKQKMYNCELNTLKKKYYDFIYSLHNTYKLIISELDELEVNTGDLLYYVSLFNINGDYNDFKDNTTFNNISNEEYNNWIKRINTLINSLINKSKIKLLSNSNIVQIKDTYSNKDNILDIINIMLDRVYLKISNGDDICI